MSKRLADLDYCEAAKFLDCPIKNIKALAKVESGGRGGFDEKGRVLIRFEGHKFRGFTAKKYDRSHPGVSYPYHSKHRNCGKNHSYGGFNEAFALDASAAMLSTSYGMFQPMGFNHEEMGYETVDEMLDDFKTGEKAQLLAFCRLIKKWGLADELRRGTLKDFTVIAKRYNGADYASNNYHNKMFNYAKEFGREKIDCSKPSAAKKETEQIPPEENEDLPVIQETENGQTQIADQITNIEAEKSVPDNFVPETKPQEAPPKENSIENAGKFTVLGFAVPSFLIAIFTAIKNAVSEGFINVSDVLGKLVNFIADNTHYLFWLIGLVIVLLIIKKVFKQITFWIQMLINANPNWHDVQVVPSNKIQDKSKWYEVWK